METSDLLLGQMKDLAAKAVQSGCAASRFLNPAEAAGLAAQFKRIGQLKLEFEGGYPGAERVRAVFFQPEWGEYEKSALFAALKIEWHPQESLGHRDILGALMALGIERHTLGDILAETRPATLICLPELAGYISENLTKAGRVGVSVARIGLDELRPHREELRIVSGTVASLRLDAILGAAFKLSRSKAVELIAAERVSLDFRVCSQPARELAAGALLSVRGLGRAQLLEAGGSSRKGRIFVRIGLYGR